MCKERFKMHLFIQYAFSESQMMYVFLVTMYFGKLWIGWMHYYSRAIWAAAASNALDFSNIIKDFTSFSIHKARTSERHLGSNEKSAPLRHIKSCFCDLQAIWWKVYWMKSLFTRRCYISRWVIQLIKLPPAQCSCMRGLLVSRWRLVITVLALTGSNNWIVTSWEHFSKRSCTL